MVENRKLITATLLGVAIAAVKAPFTFPVTDYLIIIEVPILALSFLILGRGGATLTGVVNGTLQSAVKVSFFPFDLIFAASFGILVDVFGTVLKVRAGEIVSAKRLMAAMGLASTVLGVGITYLFLALNLNPGVDLSAYSYTKLLSYVYAPIVVWGILSGVLGGFASARIWEKNLKARFKSVQPPVS
ncbi:MAG: hypothetical protein HY297_05220 [Thaumarchaeota archaeon]|nr:hypothetical protein [Nitrososphaerota archaeon]